MRLMEQNSANTGTVELHWDGPIKCGNLQFGDSGASLSGANLDGPHVYICTMNYPKANKFYAYIGKASSFERRILEHLRDTISFRYWLRDENAHETFTGADWATAFNDLEKWLPMALAEVRRYEFYAAPCEHSLLDSTERYLIKKLEAQESISNEAVICDNTRRWSCDPNLSVRHHASTDHVKEIVSLVFGCSF